MEIYYKRRCFLLLNLVLSVENVMLPIEDLMVNAICIATTGGRRLFCYFIFCILRSLLPSQQYLMSYTC
jgi:hypothetical protein